MSTTSPTDSRLPSGNLTFLFTDVEGSTKLWDQFSPLMQGVLARHDAIMRAGIERHGGMVFKTAGDAFYAAFAHPRRALDATLALQRALYEEPWPEATPIRVRMAVHCGEATLRDGDYYGPPLNVVARILSVARGGQTLVSAAVAAGGAGGARIERHGHYRMKGVATPLEVCEPGEEGISSFAPPADTDSVYRVTRVGELWEPVRTIRHNLPAERDAFVGRAQELDDLAQRLEAGARLTTVVGPGGTGKTRFARRYASVWRGDWPGGVCFCDLSEAKSLDGIMSAVAVALEVPLGEADAGVQLGHAIAARGRCLIILDNFEHLLEHAAATVGRWSERAAEAIFVVTSRERLQLPGEEILPLEPLPLNKDAIDLFVTRAKAQRPDFLLTAANREDVGRIVRLVDGLPLAIELAAARVGTLLPRQLVERMRDRFTLLAGVRGAVARQATLRAAIDWSWDLLVPWEQAALAQCAVFEGGFTLELAERVLDLSAWPGAPTPMDAVQALVDKSLLRTWIPARASRYDFDELYFGMYVSIQEYAREKLGALGPDASRAAEARHGNCFAALGADAAVEALYGREGTRHRRAMALELDNIVVACRRAVARGDCETAVLTCHAAWEVLDLQGPLNLAATLGALVAGLAGLDSSQRAAVLLTRARSLQRAGQSAAAWPLLDQTIALAQDGGDRQIEAITRSCLGNLLCTRGQMDEACAQLETALLLQRGVVNRRIEGTILTNLGRVHVDSGHVEKGRMYYDQALAIQRSLGNRVEEASVLNQIAVLLGETGRLTEARAHFEESLAISQEIGDRLSEGEVLNNLGCLHHDLGLLDEARSRYEHALTIHREVGNRRFEGYALGDLGRLNRDQGRMTDARVCLEQALAIARETGNRRIEAATLHSLGELIAEQGHDDDAARAAFAEAEVVLRDVDDKHYLALVLCGRASLARRTGEHEVARTCYAEARSLAAELLALPDSQLGRTIAALEATLG